jgi:phenylacetate-CoA ligase
VHEIVARQGGQRRARLVVGQEAGQDTMQLLVEADGSPDGLAAALADTARAVTGLRAEVTLVALESLPNDGIVIEDRRAKG